MESIESLIESWDGLAVVTRFDRPTGTWIFIALHDDALGRPVGGCRMKSYPTPSDALRDAMRLAEGMTYKWAGIELPFGGGKSVLAVSRDLRGEERAGLFRRFGRLLHGLQGAFATGMDLGTKPQDMVEIARETPWVYGVERDGCTTTDPGPFTAAGVLLSMERVAGRIGAEDLEELSIWIQGAGGVGAPLARVLAERGARVLLSDLVKEKASALASEIGGEAVSVEDTPAIPCDIYAPCAVGGVLNKEDIPRLRCRAVAGSANNQLAEISDADLLHERGILYAPDYIVNSGGALGCTLLHEGKSGDDVERALSRIGEIMDRILSEASERDESPAHAARRHVHGILEAARRDKARSRV